MYMQSVGGMCNVLLILICLAVTALSSLLILVLNALTNGKQTVNHCFHIWRVVILRCLRTPAHTSAHQRTSRYAIFVEMCSIYMRIHYHTIALLLCTQAASSSSGRKGKERKNGDLIRFCTAFKMKFIIWRSEVGWRKLGCMINAFICTLRQLCEEETSACIA